VIKPAELNDLGVVTAETPDEALNGRVEIEDHAAGMGVADHALQPKERRHAHAARNRRDGMQAGRGRKNKLPGGKLDFVLAVIFFNDQLPTIVFIRLGQKQRDRQIGADPRPR
jgi:hypothetical protein